MKNKKFISLLLASILLVSSHLGIASTEIVNDKSVSNESRNENISNAEKYFEWDPNIEVLWDKLSLVGFEIDKINYFLLLELKDYTSTYTFLDPHSKEKVVTVEPGTKDFRLYDYFEKEQEVIYLKRINLYPLDGKEFDLEKYLLSKTNGYITLGEVADIMTNLKQFDISNYYLKSRLLTLDDYEYNNTVPPKNDGLFVNKEELFIMTSTDYKNPENSKYIFLKMAEIKDHKNSTLFDLFTDEKIAKIIEGKLKYFNNSFKLPEKKNAHVRVNVSECNPEYYGILRENIEAKDGEEYYNVGMLRKLYENIPIEKRYAYEDKLVDKPGSKDFEMDDADYTPTPLPYAELTIGSKGQGVLDMKQRFLELGYFRTTSFNDRFTDSTADTVWLFEKNNGLPVDGVADAGMLGVLFSDSAVGK